MLAALINLLGSPNWLPAASIDERVGLPSGSALWTVKIRSLCNIPYTDKSRCRQAIFLRRAAHRKSRTGKKGEQRVHRLQRRISPSEVVLCRRQGGRGGVAPTFPGLAKSQNPF
jgi:hypothetical protein